MNLNRNRSNNLKLKGTYKIKEMNSIQMARDIVHLKEQQLDENLKGLATQAARMGRQGLENVKGYVKDSMNRYPEYNAKSFTQAAQARSKRARDIIDKRNANPGKTLAQRALSGYIASKRADSNLNASEQLSKLAGQSTARSEARRLERAEEKDRDNKFQSFSNQVRNRKLGDPDA